MHQSERVARAWHIFTKFVADVVFNIEFTVAQVCMLQLRIYFENEPQIFAATNVEKSKSRGVGAFDVLPRTTKKRTIPIY